MTLAKNEKIIKEWEYATQKAGMHTTKKTLTATNKRLIHEVRSSRDVTRDEVNLDNVKSLSMSSAKRISVGAVIAIIIGAILLIAGVVIKFAMEAEMVVMVPFLVIGAIIIIIAIFCLKKAAFTLDIVTNGNASIHAGSSNIVSRKKTNTVEIKINLGVANDIIENLGAILLDRGIGAEDEEEA